MSKLRKPRARVGRLPLAAEDRRRKDVRVLTTESEHGELRRAAASVSMSVSTWIRSVTLERARAMAAEKERQDLGKR